MIITQNFQEHGRLLSAEEINEIYENCKVIEE